MFVVRYTHPRTPGWAIHLEAHTRWLLAQLEAGTLLASGPLTTDTDELAVLLGGLAG